jgi:hypothetical protein
MAKATKSRSAKPKRAAAKPKRAAAKSKRAAAKPKRAAAKHKRKVGASLPVVRLVTPADSTDKNPSQKSFEKLLKKLLGSTIDYKPCYGKYDTATLMQVANNAVAAANAAVEAGQPAVIVAAGTLAATIVQDITINQGLTATIPIIQAVGGSVPANRQPNLTGFIIDAARIAQDQLAALPNAPVAVLYDDTPGNPSNAIYGLLDPLKVTPLPARTPGDLAKVTLPAGTNGFMLLPNAMFYNHCDDVVKIVDGKTAAVGGPLPIYYPEREYKQAHKISKSGVKVLGHHVAFTYRLAATYVDSILNGDLQIPLPELAGAIPDQF